MKALRQPTLETIGLGSVINIFKNGRLPADTDDLVDQVFGESNKRGALVISGANGVVGAGKTAQFGSRLLAFNVPIVGLDFAGAPDGIGAQYQGLRNAFGARRADEIMANITRLSYDGHKLPAELMKLNPRFLLEAVPEVLEIKKAHYQIFRTAFPDIEIRSVTSGFPSSELGVGIAHPAFPHQVNKVWEIVEPHPSPITRLLWAIGLIPIPVSDNWSFVLDVLFCGLALSALRYHRAANMPFWKIDKYVRLMLGPNPFRAHDAIGAKGANFLTWSCLHHLAERYGALFTPTPELVTRKETGQNWYPMNHFRPLVNWTLEKAEEDDLRTWILGSLIQMTSLMLHENRAPLAHINAIGELCAQFRNGIVATIRQLGRDESIKIVEKYQHLHPGAAECGWYPDVFRQMDRPEWQQLYVNAEHDGKVGVISISRESYNGDIDDELNRAMDWLKTEGIERVIVTGDFHLSTQMIGADTSEFYDALGNPKAGLRVSLSWSKTARRLNDEFKISVGFLNGKRCLGGFLELLMHCHYLISVADCELGMPEVTLPVVPGMEGCHWAFRKNGTGSWPKILHMLLSGMPVKAKNAVGWLVDFAGPMEASLKMAWNIVSDGPHNLSKRMVKQEALQNRLPDVDLPDPGNPLIESGRKAILDCVMASCGVALTEALAVQATHSSQFMISSPCQKGKIGTEAAKIMSV